MAENVKQKVAPRFVQIAVASGYDADSCDAVYGLDVDGRVWRCLVVGGELANRYGWRLMSDRIHAVSPIFPNR